MNLAEGRHAEGGRASQWGPQHHGGAGEHRGQPCPSTIRATGTAPMSGRGEPEMLWLTAEHPELFPVNNSLCFPQRPYFPFGV